jgi:uncharacterized protein (DUF2062 family)
MIDCGIMHRLRTIALRGIGRLAAEMRMSIEKGRHPSLMQMRIEYIYICIIVYIYIYIYWKVWLATEIQMRREREGRDEQSK